MEYFLIIRIFRNLKSTTMQIKLLLIICLMIGTFSLTKVTAQEPYKATWESLDSHKMPQWYDDAKIGLSMHWGVYSVPA
ncbi:MAG: alpha-L-fucosidase, partial [Mariniphaga sp.]|nr:alpha-L-fucosidase [Mariniphaga sp.]